MPFVKVTLQETVESVSRPIIFDIISQVKSITKIDQNTKVIFPGDTGRMQQQGSSIESQNRQTELETGKYVYIEVEEDFDPQYMASTAINFPEQNPFFFDKDTSVSIGPLYATTQVTIHFKYKASSRTELLRWRDDIRMRLSGMRDINLHDISYHYLIPDQFMLLLQAVYANKERVLSDGQLFSQYVASNIVSRAKLISDMVGNDVRLSIAETQCRIIGRYDFDSMPEKPKRDAENSIWEGEFSYKFTYEKPVMATARYPVIIYNQLLPKDFIGFWNTDYRLENVKKSYSLSIGAFSHFEVQKQPDKYINYNAEARLPSFDDFNPRVAPTSAVGIFNALCQVDEIDFVTLMNLGDLGDYILDADILNFIQQSELPFICNLYQSIFTLNLYTNYTLMETGNLVCAPDLTVQSVNKLSLRNFYHVRLTLTTDLSLINYAFFQRLQGYPKALYKIVTAVNESMRNNPKLQSIAELPVVTDLDFNIIYAQIMGLRNVGKNNIQSYLTQRPNTAVQTSQSVIYSSADTDKSKINPLYALQGDPASRYHSSAKRLHTVYLGNILAVKKESL